MYKFQKHMSEYAEQFSEETIAGKIVKIGRISGESRMENSSKTLLV
jgi:hypothetical protein